MKINWKLLGIVSILLGGLALGGCSATMGDSASNVAAVTTGGYNQPVFTGTAQAGNVSASVVGFKMPYTKDVFGGIVISKAGFFTPSTTAIIPFGCFKDPHCKDHDALAGFGEPTGNVLIGGVSNVLGAYLGRSSGDSFNVSATGGTGNGGQATSNGSTVTNTNDVTNKNVNKNTNKSSSSSKSSSDSTSISIAGSGSSSGNGGGSGGGKPGGGSGGGCKDKPFNITPNGKPGGGDKGCGGNGW